MLFELVFFWFEKNRRHGLSRLSNPSETEAEAADVAAPESARGVRVCEDCIGDRNASTEPSKGEEAGAGKGGKMGLDCE